ncbi:MAG: hypothetical protein VX938_03875 [Myxococcota bacterium]|nr:hypothetical protein [Myxococcota bacterium]
MTIHATRALLLSNLLRGGDQRRIVRLLDRLDPRDLSGLLLELHDLDLRKAGRVLLGPERVAGSVEFLTEDALDELIRTADDDDAKRALVVMSEQDDADELRTMDSERRTLLLETQDTDTELPGASRTRSPDVQETLTAVFRLRRLFA